MAMVELSDLYGAVINQAQKLEVTPEELLVMSKATANSFASRPSFGRAEDWKKYLRENNTSVITKSGVTQVWTDHYTYFLIFGKDDSYFPSFTDVDRQFNTLVEVIYGQITEPMGKKYGPNDVLFVVPNRLYKAEKGTMVRVKRNTIPMSTTQNEMLEDALKCL